MIRFFNTYEPVTGFFRDLIPALAKAGISTEIVLSKTEYRQGRPPLEEALHGQDVRIRRVPSGLRNCDRTWKKIATNVTYCIGAFLCGLVGSRSSVNFFLTQPPMYLIAGLLLKHLRGQRYCALIMDIYPDVLVADGRMDASGLLYRSTQKLMRRALAQAEQVFVIGHCMRDYLVEKAALEKHKLTVIHNWANEQLITPIQRNENPFAKRFQLYDEFAILYSGNMGVAHNFDSILEVARRLRNRSDIVFIFLGKGARRPSIEEFVHTHELDNVYLSDFVPDSELSNSQSLGDVHFVTLRDEFTGLVVPSKAYSALCAGRALIYEGNPRGEIARMITEQRIGTVVKPGSTDDLEKAVLEFAENRHLCQEYGEHARDCATGILGREAALSWYVEVLSGLLKGGRRPPS